ncbi:MAG: hypothetical protein ACRCT8_02390 [Lacipirellulaceae bacterium]
MAWRSSLLAAALSAATAGTSLAQTNLLVGGGFDINFGFGGAPFTESQNFGSFRGFDGWRSDLADDGDNNNQSWDETTPGGDLFLNIYPNDLLFAGNDGVLPPILSGIGGSVMLGPYDGNVFSGLYQQVTAVPGNTYRVTGFFISDPTQRTGSNQPDTIFAQSTTNWAGLKVEFKDFLGLDLPADAIELRALDAAVDDPLQVDGKWIETTIEVQAPTDATLIRWVGLFAQFANAGGLVHLDNASIVNLTAGAPLLGDFDYDGVRDADDLHMLRLTSQGKLVAASNRFDLNTSGGVDAADIAAWIALGGIQGDYNGDGAVNAADYTVFRDTLDATGPGLAADDNADRRIDQADYIVWQRNYGPGATSATAIPEPTAAVLGCLALAGVARRRR